MSFDNKLKQIVEAALLAAGRPLSLDQLQALFTNPASGNAAEGIPPEMEVVEPNGERRPRRSRKADEAAGPDKRQLREAIDALSEEYADRGFELREVGSGFRIQVRSEFAPWVSRLYAERPPKYSRALLETLALIAYRQPITRGEIEEIRGVSVSSNIVKTLTEREWVRVVGHRDVPGKPALYATTKEFLDYFNLKSLSELPTLAEIRDLDSINRELELKDPELYEPPQAEVTEETPEAEPEGKTGPLASVSMLSDEQDTGDLIEADPDGETDSGVVHRPHEAKTEATPMADQPIEFDPDGETGYSGDFSGMSDEQSKRDDETD